MAETCLAQAQMQGLAGDAECRRRPIRHDASSRRSAGRATPRGMAAPRCARTRRDADLMGMCRACAASAPVCAAIFLVLEKCDTSRLVALHLIVAIASRAAIAPRAPGTRHEHGAEGEGEADARDGGEGAKAHAGEFLELMDQVRLAVAPDIEGEGRPFHLGCWRLDQPPDRLLQAHRGHSAWG